MTAAEPTTGPISGPAAAVPAPAPPRHSALSYLLRHRPTAIAVVALTVLVILAFLGPSLLPDGMSNNSKAVFQPPSWSHPFGTDWLGREQLTRVAIGLRITLLIAGGSLVIPVVIGVPLGILAGYRGGWVDAALMRSVDVLFAFPALLLAMMVVAILGPGMFNVMIAIGILYLPHLARVARGPVLTVRTEDFVTASRCAGTSELRVIWRHILPNALPAILVQTALVLSAAILTEATLSFLGLGAQPPTPTLGGMITASRTHMRRAPWLAIFPGLTIAVLVAAVNTLGDGLREALDPRLRSSRRAPRRAAPVAVVAPGTGADEAR